MQTCRAGATALGLADVHPDIVQMPFGRRAASAPPRRRPRSVEGAPRTPLPWATSSSEHCSTTGTGDATNACLCSRVVAAIAAAHARDDDEDPPDPSETSRDPGGSSATGRHRRGGHRWRAAGRRWPPSTGFDEMIMRCATRSSGAGPGRRQGSHKTHIFSVFLNARDASNIATTRRKLTTPSACTGQRRAPSHGGPRPSP